MQCWFLTVFYNSCNIMDIRRWVGGMGWWVVGVGVDGQAEGRPSLLLGHRQWCYVLSSWQGCTQTTGKIETAIGNSLVPNQFWLVLPSGPTGPVMHQLGFTGSAKSRLWKQTWLSIATYLMFLDGAWVYH